MIVPYQDNTVRNTDLPDVNLSARASAASFGGGQAENIGRIGQTTEGLGNTITDIGLNEQEKVNHDIARKNVNDARLELSQFANAEYAKSGSDAFGATQRIQDQAAKIGEKYSGNMETMAQQDIFNNVFQQYSAEHAERAMVHEQEQKKVFRNQTLDQENQINSDDITAHMNDPAFVEKRLFEISQNVKSMNSGRGDQQKLVDGVIQGTLMNAIAEKALTDPAQALVFLESHQDKLKPNQAMIMRDSLQKKEFEMRKADIVMGETSRPGATREEVIAAINNTKLPPDQKEATIRDAMTQFNVVDAAREKDKRDANEASWNSFYKKPDLATIATLNIDPTEKQKMTDTLDKMTKKKTDDEYAQNFGQIQRLSTDEFLKFNLEEVKQDISPYQYDHLKREQATLRKDGIEKSPGLKKAIEDETGEAKQYSPFKIDEKNDSDVVKEKKQTLLNQYVGEYTQRLMQVPDDKRNDPNIRSDIKNQLLKEKINSHWFWFDTKSGQVDYTPNQPAKAPTLTAPVSQSAAIASNEFIPDKKKAALLIRDDLSSGKITKEQARQKLQEIGY